MAPTLPMVEALPVPIDLRGEQNNGKHEITTLYITEMTNQLIDKYIMNMTSRLYGFWLVPMNKDNTQITFIHWANVGVWSAPLALVLCQLLALAQCWHYVATIGIGTMFVNWANVGCRSTESRWFYHGGRIRPTTSMVLHWRSMLSQRWFLVIKQYSALCWYPT